MPGKNADLMESSTLQALYAERQQHMDEKLDALKQDVGAIKTALLGNVGNGARPGLVVRLDRIEQKFAIRDKLIWLITPIVIGLVVNRLMEGL